MALLVQAKLRCYGILLQSIGLNLKTLYLIVFKKLLDQPIYNKIQEVFNGFDFENEIIITGLDKIAIDDFKKYI